VRLTAQGTKAFSVYLEALSNVLGNHIGKQNKNFDTQLLSMSLLAADLIYDHLNKNLHEYRGTLRTF